MTVLLRREVLNKVPPVCGVYLFYDAGNRLLYVGKSKNLRRRMAGYFSGNGINRETRPAWRWGRIRRFEWVETPSELTALLLEDFWIKKLKPRWNIRQAQMKERCWLVFRPREIPPLTVETERPAGQVIGPLKDVYFAERLKGSLARFLRLPDCREKETKRCLRKQTGQCLAPCRSEGKSDEYQRTIAYVNEILDGRTAPLEELIKEEMEQEAAALRFERAALFREELAFWKAYRQKQAFINRFNRQPLIIREAAEHPVWHFFDNHGYRFGMGDFPEYEKRVEHSSLLIPNSGNALYRYDAALIIYSFLKNNDSRLTERWL